MFLENTLSQNGDLIVKLNGEMDANGCIQIRPDLEQITHSETGNNITLDLHHVSFLDSSGVGAIVFLYKRLKEQKRTLEITGIHGQPQELVSLLRIDTVIPVHMDKPENSLIENSPCAS